MEFVRILLYLVAVYVIFCKILPFCFYPNYLRKSRVENYPDLKNLSLRLKGDDQLQTIKNIWDYMQQTYSGSDEVLNINNLLSVFLLGDFSTDKILNKKQFLWCHSQNRLFKSILLNTGKFKEEDVVIQRKIFASFFIHQWLVVNIEGKKVKMDPYYNLFNVE